MFFKMFSEMTGWRRVLAELLHLVMFFGLVLFMAGEVDNYLLPARAGYPETVWYFIAIASLATVLIALLTRTVAFFWSTLLMGIAVVFMITSFRLFEGEIYPTHRTLDVLVGIGCLAVYWVLYGLAERRKKSSIM